MVNTHLDALRDALAEQSFRLARKLVAGAPNAEVRRALSDFETAVANLRGAAEVYMIENTAEKPRG